MAAEDAARTVGLPRPPGMTRLHEVGTPGHPGGTGHPGGPGERWPRVTDPPGGDDRSGAATAGRNAGGDRVGALDALRGLALAGILFVNIPPVLNLTAVAGEPWSIRHFLDLFVQQRFFPIFSVLFGIGFAIFLERARPKARRPRVLLLRRLLVLGVLGWLHQVLQPGEALLPYALVGLVVLLPLSYLPWWLNLVASAVLLVVAMVLTSGGISLLPGMLLLGFALGQSGVPWALHRHGRAIAVLFALATAASVAALLWQEQEPLMAGFSASSAIAGLCLATAYSTGLLLLLRTRVGPALSAVLAPFGRMALTNYLTATLLFIPLGHLTGVADSGHWVRMLLLACGIIVLQLVWSRLWLSRFRYGPLEWAWRCSTWWRVVPLRRDAAPAPSPDSAVR
ncbi:DUF418 domain-containing protein [Saccharopolyspora cebuensis]|uniref:DUF418 domain-containing protein n=1 Tax=Saccharopolyspora cebuensis TaxID=418759 RepID=A0ABV4CMK9_9PSEU